jgi:hypothetical protein
MTKNYKKYLVLAIATVFLIGGTGTVLGQVRSDAETFSNGTTDVSTRPNGVSDVTVTSVPKTVKLDNPIAAKNITELLLSLVDLAISLGSIVAVLMFIYIGFKFIMAQGSESDIKDAKQWFLYAVIGTALLVSSKVVVEVVKNTIISTGLVNTEIINR